MSSRTYRSSTSEETKTLTVRLSQPVYDAASATASAQNVSLNLLIENAVSSYVVNNSAQVYSSLTASAGTFATQAEKIIDTVTNYQSALNALSGKPDENK